MTQGTPTTLLAVCDTGPQMTAQDHLSVHRLMAIVRAPRPASQGARPGWITIFFGHLYSERPHLEEIAEPVDGEGVKVLPLARSREPRRTTKERLAS